MKLITSFSIILIATLGNVFVAAAPAEVAQPIEIREASQIIVNLPNIHQLTIILLIVISVEHVHSRGNIVTQEAHIMLAMASQVVVALQPAPVAAIGMSVIQSITGRLSVDI